MDFRLQIGQLEGAINRCKLAEPFSNAVLPPDMRLMATLYGEMIFLHLDSIEFEALPASLQAVIRKWALMGNAGVDQSSCTLRYGDAGTGNCEACQ